MQDPENTEAQVRPMALEAKSVSIPTVTRQVCSKCRDPIGHGDIVFKVGESMVCAVCVKQTDAVEAVAQYLVRSRKVSFSEKWNAEKNAKRLAKMKKINEASLKAEIKKEREKQKEPAV